MAKFRWLATVVCTLLSTVNIQAEENCNLKEMCEIDVGKCVGEFEPVPDEDEDNLNKCANVHRLVNVRVKANTYNSFRKEGHYTSEIVVEGNAEKMENLTYSMTLKKNGTWTMLENCCNLSVRGSESCTFPDPGEGEVYFNLPCTKPKWYHLYREKIATPYPWCSDHIKISCMKMLENHLTVTDDLSQDESDSWEFNVIIFEAPLTNIQNPGSGSWEHNTHGIELDEKRGEVVISTAEGEIKPKATVNTTDENMKAITKLRPGRCKATCLFVQEVVYDGSSVYNRKPVCYVPKTNDTIRNCEDPAREKRQTVTVVAIVVGICLFLFVCLTACWYFKRKWEYIYREPEINVPKQTDDILKEDSNSLHDGDSRAEEVVHRIGSNDAKAIVVESNNNESSVVEMDAGEVDAEETENKETISLSPSQDSTEEAEPLLTYSTSDPWPPEAADSQISGLAFEEENPPHYDDSAFTNYSFLVSGTLPSFSDKEPGVCSPGSYMRHVINSAGSSVFATEYISQSEAASAAGSYMRHLTDSGCLDSASGSSLSSVSTPEYISQFEIPNAFSLR